MSSSISTVLQLDPSARIPLLKKQSEAEEAQNSLQAKAKHTHPNGASGAEDASVFFIGTATTVIEWQGLRILTDPNFLHAGDHVHLGPGVNATRRTNPAVELDKLPPIDCILLSHYHEDHFDRVVEDSLNRDFPIITTPHAKECLTSTRVRNEPFSSITSLDFFETACLNITQTSGAQAKRPVVKVSGMPGKHVPPGPLSIANDILQAVPPTNGWLLELGYVPISSSTSAGASELEVGYRIYISGDTLLVDELKEIPKYLQNEQIDLMLVHLGGTTIPGPSLPMLMVTMDAKQGLQLMQMMNPDITIPIHFDDYDVFTSPLSDFKKEVQQEGLENKVVYLDRGESYNFVVKGKVFVMPATSNPQHFSHTSGATDAVWVHKDSYENRPHFTSLSGDAEADVCIVGAGISGISVAYELVIRGQSVILLEARDILSGETGRTSGHLANALDDHYIHIAKKHGREGAQVAADSHTWALNRVGEIANELGIDCEYRKVPGYEISQYPRGDKNHTEDMKELKEEADLAKQLGLHAEFREDLAIKGWTGELDQRGGAVFEGQAAFHPTLYLVGILRWLQKQPNFKCFTSTRVMSLEEHGSVLGLGAKSVTVQTEKGPVVRCGHAVEATCIPLQKLAVIVEMEYYRTYSIAIRVPKGSVEDCFLYDSAEEYKYVRFTACDEKDDYMIVGGCDHKVGQDTVAGRFEELETWTRERFPHVGTVDYKWSGQVNEPVDFMAFIGKNQGCDRVYVITGDSGNGLTHGVLAGRIIGDEIDGQANPWAKLYSPKRTASIIKSAKSMITHDLQVNAQYKRFAQSDITDIEDLIPGSGGVMKAGPLDPVAVYKDENGNVTKMSALCPHLKGVVCWNPVEKSFDCPIHGSRFSNSGLCIMGPAKANLATAS
ncbi:putative Rieske 2Fe-2S iron-sulfur protein YhfW [Paramyrothecium foliicola]|nr:putative Rieske 2Fe-2S iron-sulfur protein YhfW [Paramyrothecium foliicola]